MGKGYKRKPHSHRAHGSQGGRLGRCDITTEQRLKQTDTSGRAVGRASTGINKAQPSLWIFSNSWKNNSWDAVLIVCVEVCLPSTRPIHPLLLLKLWLFFVFDVKKAAIWKDVDLALPAGRHVLYMEVNMKRNTKQRLSSSGGNFFLALSKNKKTPKNRSNKTAWCRTRAEPPDTLSWSYWGWGGDVTCPIGVGQWKFWKRSYWGAHYSFEVFCAEKFAVFGSQYNEKQYWG